MIVHISSDYPDAFEPRKSSVIRTLIELASPAFEHRVYSLNRISPSAGALATSVLRHPVRPHFAIRSIGDSAPTTLTYAAPGRGLYHRAALDRVADWIAADIARGTERPELILGHKLTMEGIVAEAVATRIGVPFALSIQGNTDRRILRARPDLRPLLRRVFHSAAVVFPFTPWALTAAESTLGKRSAPTLLLPCPTDQDRIIAPQIVGRKLVSAFHLKHRRLKNADLLIAAAAGLDRAHVPYTLEILGGGDPRDIDALRDVIARRGAHHVTLAGAIPHDSVQARMNEAAGLVMISRRESFGLVFVEALLAGCPIAYPRDSAVDGYFDGLPFALPVAQDDLAACREAMARLTRDEVPIKAALSKWQSGPGPRRFQRTAIAAQFTQGLRLAVSAPAASWQERERS